MSPDASRPRCTSWEMTIWNMSMCLFVWKNTPSGIADLLWTTIGLHWTFNNWQNSRKQATVLHYRTCSWRMSVSILDLCREWITESHIRTQPTLSCVKCASWGPPAWIHITKWQSTQSNPPEDISPSVVCRNDSSLEKFNASAVALSGTFDCPFVKPIKGIQTLISRDQFSAQFDSTAVLPFHVSALVLCHQWYQIDQLRSPWRRLFASDSAGWILRSGFVPGRQWHVSAFPPVNETESHNIYGLECVAFRAAN